LIAAIGSLAAAGDPGEDLAVDVGELAVRAPLMWQGGTLAPSIKCRHSLSRGRPTAAHEADRAALELR
jgi:hypothetical protein